MDNSKVFSNHVASKRDIWIDDDDSEHWLIYYLRDVLGVLGAFFLHILIGAIYRWSMINSYITSFYKITDNPDLITKRDKIVAIISMFCVGLTMRLGSRLAKQIGTFWNLLIFVFLATICVLISSFMSNFYCNFESILVFVLFHCIAYSLCVGMLFLPPIQECQRYHPSNKIFANTFTLVGTGLGLVSIGLINTSCMNP